MHFQVDDAAHNKLVICMGGKALDVIVDVRSDSPDFNKPISFNLNSTIPSSFL